MLEPVTLPRPLGAVEHAFWLKDRSMPYHFAVCAEIEGATTIPAWRSALAMVQRRHPHFSIRIDVDSSGVPWFVPVKDAPLPLRIVMSDNPRWEAEMARELAIPFDARQAPLVRAVLLLRPYRSFLVLAAHHSITDTKSLVFAIRDALQALSGQSLDPLPPIGPLDRLLQPFQASADAYGQATFPAAGPLEVYRGRDTALPVVKALVMAPALTDGLRRRCRTEGTTIHGALVAASVLGGRHLSNRLEGSTITVGSAVDVRTAIGGGEHVALLSGGGSIVVEPPMHDCWDIARFAKRSIAPMQSPVAMAGLLAGLADHLSTHRSAEDAQALFAGFRFDINISNLGVLPIETRFGDLTFKRLWGPSILAGFEGEQQIGVATMHDSISLLHTSFTPLPSLLESMHEHLAAACR
jgi:Condensation domain